MNKETMYDISKAIHLLQFILKKYGTNFIIY